MEMVSSSVGAVTQTVSGIGGALSYYAGSLWGSSVPAEPEKPAENNQA